MIEKDKKEILNESDKIWEEIKNLPIDMFALPNQCVKQHVQRIKVTPNEVHLKFVSSAVTASIENALSTVRGKKYIVEFNEGYTVIRRGVSGLNFPKPEPVEK